MPIFPGGLSSSDLDRLERYLAAPERRESTMPLDATQGLLCAVVSAPAVVLPSRWLPAVLGEDHEYASMEEAREITTLLLGLQNDVARQLNQGKSLEFLFYGNEGDDHDSVADWCEGYLIGVGLAEPSWESLADEETLMELLFPFFMLSGRWDAMLEEEGKPPMDAATRDEVMTRLRLALVDEVIANRRYWQDRMARPQRARAGPKVGRNDPCPCGSGKKFKACCGAR